MSAGQEGIVQAAVLNAAQEVERSLDNELNALSNIQDDDLEAIRKRRLTEMRKKAEDEVMWRRRGHGTLTRIVEKDFFKHSNDTARVVLLVIRPGASLYSADMQDHLTRVAERHLETFFAVLDADKAPFLCDRFNLKVMPSVILVKEKKVDKVLHGLDAFSSDGKLNTVEIERRLRGFDMVTHMDIGDES